MSMFLFLLHMPKMYDDHAEILTEKNLILILFVMLFTNDFLKSCIMYINFINYLGF